MEYECYLCMDYDQSTGLCYCDTSKLPYEEFLFDSVAVGYYREALRRGLSARESFISARDRRRAELRDCQAAGLTLSISEISEISEIS